MPLNPNSQLGPYKIEEKIGEGGMGEVYQAIDTRLDRQVAIKVLSERFLEDTQARVRFEREAKAVASLSHPNVITIYDIGMEDGKAYAVMELLKGETLGQRMERSKIDDSEAISIAIAVAEGLEAAHQNGVIHRDIKPANIFLSSSGSIKVLDFGLARMEAPSVDMAATVAFQTEPGMVMGTVSYMAPEQLKGQAIDARCDVFALGCVLFEMLGGRRPFEGKTGPETFAAILHEAPVAIDEGSLPEGMPHVLSRALEKDTEKRYQTAKELATALQVLKGQTQRVKQVQLDTDVEIPRQLMQEEQSEVSIAVLPFANVSPDPENEYFSDGLSEELISVLSKVEGLHVASRTSSFMFKGKNEDIRTIGQHLNVTSVLEGGVRKAGSRLRISAQLTNVETGYQLWSETYNRQLEDIFEIQDEIAQKIAEALQVVLKKEETESVTNASTEDVEAYDFYLRGRNFFHQFRKRGYEFALEMFAKAIEIDPNYALAYAGIADCHTMLYFYWDSSEANKTGADESSRKALELAEHIAETHLSRGMALMLKSDFEDARKEFECAIKLSPDFFEAYYFYGRALLSEGKLEKAADVFETASKIRPDDYQSLGHIGAIYEGLGRNEEALEADRRALAAAEKRLRLNPDDARVLYLTAVSLARLGEKERCLEWATRALNMDPYEPVTLYNVGCVYALLHEVDKAVDCLERAIANGFSQKQWFINDSDLDSLRENPRFKTTLAEMT